ncbi:MAG: DUF4982 domain-containing protein [Clostridia bacterium]
MVKLFPHWNWEGREGEPIPVVCFTNCDYVELFLNGRFLGRQSYEFPRLGMNMAFGCYDRPNRVGDHRRFASDVAGSLRAG